VALYYRDFDLGRLQITQQNRNLLTDTYCQQRLIAIAVTHVTVCTTTVWGRLELNESLGIEAKLASVRDMSHLNAEHYC